MAVESTDILDWYYEKKHFNKWLVMTKEDDEYFESTTKWWIFDNVHVGDGVKVRDH